MSKRSALAAFCGVLALLSVVNLKAAEPAAAGLKHVLLVTGDDIAAHRWRETAPMVKTLLAQDPCLEVSILEDLAALDKIDLGKYDAVVLHFKNRTPEVPGAPSRANLEKFVRDGGGLVILPFRQRRLPGMAGVRPDRGPGLESQTARARSARPVPCGDG